MKRQKTILVVMIITAFVLAVIAVLVLRMSSVQRKYNRQISLGDKYLEELDYENAEFCYKAALDINERAMKPYIKLSNIYTDQNEFDKAYDILEKAQAVDDKYNKNKNTEILMEQIEYIDTVLFMA